MKNSAVISVLFYFVCCIVLAQEKDSLSVVLPESTLLTKEIIKEPYNPFAPSKAAFYSAVIPGLGQAYNEKYWKIPIIYAGIGTSIYFRLDNEKAYNRYRDAYKRRLAGYQDDEFQGVSDQTLIRAQRRTKRNMDASTAVAIGFYLLNIIDANVDAHLKQYNISEDLSLMPNIDYNHERATTSYGFSLNIRLK